MGTSSGSVGTKMKRKKYDVSCTSVGCQWHCCVEARCQMDPEQLLYASPSEADTGGDKAHKFSWDKDTREGPLAYTMGFKASSPGQGRVEPWLKEQQELRQMQEERDAVAGSPSPQLDSTAGASASSSAPVVPMRGSVLLDTRSRSPNKREQSSWWQGHAQQQQQATWRQPSSSSSWWSRSSTRWQQPHTSSWWQSGWSTWRQQ